MDNKGEEKETVTDFILFGLKITVDGDCKHKIKDVCSLEESYDRPRNHIKKQRHHFANKVSHTVKSQSHIVKAVVFLVVIYRCEKWIIKKDEH